MPPGLVYVIHKKYIPRWIYKSSVGALKFNFYFNFWRRFLRELFEDNPYDVIHIHDLPLARIGIEIRHKHTAKFILDLHENWPALLKISKHTSTFLGKLLCSIRQWQRYESRMVSEADEVITVVDEARERIAHLGAYREKIHVVSNTLNLEMYHFTMRNKETDYLTMVYGGGINYHRGLQIAIRALRPIAEKIPNIRLLIIGSGSYLADLKALAMNLGVENYIEFTGWKPQQEALDLMSGADIAIIPHIRSEHTDSTIPHKIFQYMYAGIPILSSDCVPLKRILDETGTGTCFEDQNEKSFAENLLHLASNKELLEKIPENGRYWVEKKYNWNNDARVLTGIYKTIRHDNSEVE
jgi:glycosyltransferase involved in cell wall biosynthesis